MGAGEERGGGGAGGESGLGVESLVCSAKSVVRFLWCGRICKKHITTCGYMSGGEGGWPFSNTQIPMRRGGSGYQGVLKLVSLVPVVTMALVLKDGEETP